MKHPAQPILSIIGAGSIGASLGKLWSERGVVAIGGVKNRSLESSQVAVEAIGSGTPLSPDDPLPRSDLICIATADDAIPSIAAHLSGLTARLSGTPVIFHCSGVLSSAALAPLKKNLSTSVASAHPAVSWSQRGMQPLLHQSPLCALEGDEEAVALLSDAFTRIGFHPFVLSAATKARYHAALAIASNYTVTLASIATELLETCNLSRTPSLDLIRGLLGSTIENLTRLPPQEALTGPLVRGDLETISLHLTALCPFPEILQAYKTLGIATLRLASERYPERETLYHDAERILSDTPTTQDETRLSIKIGN